MKRLERIPVTARIVILTAVLFIVQAVGALFMPTFEPDSPAVESMPATSVSFLGLVLVLCLLQTIALAYPILRSRWSGWRLTIATFVLFFGTVTFLHQIESLVYLRSLMPPGMLGGIFLMGLFNAAMFSPIAVALLGKWRDREESSGEWSPRPAAIVTWKVAAAGLVFLACYYLFGYYVAWQSPAVRAHYGGSDPGSFFAQMTHVATATPWMIPLQYLRGILWVLLGLLVVRMMRGHWWEVGVALSLLFTVPVLYLLYPNPVMPEAVRMVHLVEMLPYQFLFGWFVAWLFASRPISSAGRSLWVTIGSLANGT